jgi:hypothetical protein
VRRAYVFQGLDEQKVIEAARIDSKPGFARDEPEEVEIHYHRHGEECDGQQHRKFFDGEEVKYTETQKGTEIMNFLEWLQTRGCIVEVTQEAEVGGNYYIMQVTTPEGDIYNITETFDPEEESKHGTSGSPVVQGQ